jgi:PAS domain S-box-containing protein
VSEERYRELFENAKDALYVHDLSGRYVSLNRAAEKLIGFSRDEIIGKHFSNFVVPRDLKHVRKNFCKKLDEESETSYEIDLLTKDRRRVPVEVVSRLIYENGEPVGVQGTARDITERKRAQDALQMYSRRLIEAQEAERQSLARELHDEIGQVLTAVRINLHAVQSTHREDGSLPELEESIVIVDEALGRIHELCLELRPSLLDNLGLAAALRWYVDRYRERTGIVAEVLNGFEGRGRLPQELETQCFRIAQEALTNVARHARATRVSIQVQCAAEKLVLTIIDNGIGFDTENLLKAESSASTLGLRGMKERALAMNGRIVIESTPGNGTQIEAIFPLRRQN